MHTNLSRRNTIHHRGAAICLTLVAIWSIIVLWLHLFEPTEINTLELVILITLVAAGVTLTPIVWLRAKWGYLLAVILFIGILGGGVFAISENSFFFSFSVYNVSVIAVDLIAVAGIYFSLLAFRAQPQPPLKSLIFGFIGAALFITLAVFLVQSNTDAIYRFRAIQIQDRLARQLEDMASVDEQLEFLVEKGQIPSLSVGIVVNDALVWTGDYGDTEPNMAYLTGSVAKMFTATAVMQLYEQNLIDLDADISNYLPFTVRHPAYAQQPITTRMLLRHQSGLKNLTIPQEAYFIDETMINWLSNKHGWPIQSFSPRPPLTDYLEGMLTPGSPYFFDEVWSSNQPGSDHLYANTNYFLLALLIESVTGQTFSEYMQQHIFSPLQMTTTGYDPDILVDRMATGYEREFALLSKTNVPVPVYQNVPGPGGLISTVSDLSQFMIAQLNQGQVGDVQLLTPESVALMHQQKIEGSGHINKTGYSLGFTHLSTTPWQYYGHFYGLNGAIGHEGGNIGYAGAVYWIEKDEGGYGFVLLMNESTIENGVDFSWYFPIYYKINTLLMSEAAAQYANR